MYHFFQRCLVTLIKSLTGKGSKVLIFLSYSQVTQRGKQSLAAVWSEKGQVEIFDLQPQLDAVHSAAAMAAFVSQQKEATALFSFSGHMTEGFAIDWSPTVPGNLSLYFQCKNDTMLIANITYRCIPINLNIVEKSICFRNSILKK